MTAKERGELLQLHELMKSAFAGGDRRAYFLANQKTHALFVRAAGSSTLEETHQILTKRARHDRPVTLESALRWSESLAEHEDLIAAVKAGEAARAGMLMLRHVRRTGVALAEIARLSAEP
jgi:DNA-binding GntR family transcriptional regulator